MMEIILRKYKVDKYIHKKAPSQMLAWVLNTPLLFEDSSNALFFQRIFHYKVPEICSILLFFKILLLLINQKKILFPCSNARRVRVKFYITYIITSIVFISQLGYLLSILIILI